MGPLPRFTLCLAMLVMLAGRLACAQDIAVTFDDGPDMGDRVLMSAEERNAAILRQLGDAHVKSMLFLTRVGDPNRMDLVRQWGIHGHGIANHTATHPDFDEVTLADFERDFLTCDAAIRDLPGFARWFRFPYLKEGETRDKRDGFREFLRAHDYRIGAVSVDTSDWYYSRRLTRLLERNPKLDLGAFRDAYLRHLYGRAVYGRAVAAGAGALRAARDAPPSQSHERALPG